MAQKVDSKFYRIVMRIAMSLK